MITDPDNLLTLCSTFLGSHGTSEIISRAAVGDYRWWSSLNHVDWNIERSRECLNLTLAYCSYSFKCIVRRREKGERRKKKDKEAGKQTHLRFSTPFSSFRDHPAIFLKSSIIHHPIISSSSCIFTSNRRQESNEIIFVFSHVLSCGFSGY